MTPFGTRLAHAIEERGRFCVGIDPHAALLHEWGLGDDVASLERFALTVVGAGGIVDADDVRSFLAAGATAVQIGTALLHDPTTAARAVADLRGAP